MNFLSNVTIGQYVQGNSFLHKMDSRWKMIIVLILIIQCFLLNKWILLCIPFIFLALTALLTNISWKFIMRGLKAVLPFALITLIFNSFLTAGHPAASYTYPSAFSIFPYWTVSSPAPNPPEGIFYAAVTYEGIEFGFFMALRLLIIVLATSIFTLTTSPMEITDGLESLMKWGKPLKIPVHEIAMMMSIALRFIPTLTEHLEKIVKAQMSRGADFEAKSIITKAKCFIPVLIPLFVNAFKTADELAAAMESRCYRGGEGRTRFKVMKSTWRDGAACTVTILLCTVLTIFQYT